MLFRFRSARARRLLLDASLPLAMTCAAALAACGGGSTGSGGGTLDAGGDALDDATTDANDDANDDAADTEFDLDAPPVDAAHVFDVQPTAMQVLTVPIGSTTTTATFTATLDGVPANAAWSVDRGDLGTIAATATGVGTFTAKGTTGGLVTITAGLNGEKLTRKLFIKLTGGQDGADTTKPGQAAQIPANVGALKAGGGVGGVGGEGLGPATDAATKTALGSPVGDGVAQGLKFLYPYDKTVWPRGMLAPLLMWDWSGGDADAIQLELSTSSGSFAWKGTFARPAILATTGGKFVRHPIPQDVWQMATDTAGGPTPSASPDTLTVALTVVRGGQAYGPVHETWTIAPGRLSGTIYYNSYGTQLAKNFGGAVGGDHQFGGGVLSIRAGDTAPKLAAGGNGGADKCQTCHSVAANGSRLVVQHGENYSTSSSYDLSPTGSTEHVMTAGAWFPGVSPDGSVALAPDGRLFVLPTATAAAVLPGLSTVATAIGTPAFSPDSKLIAFNAMAGATANPTQKLLVMAYDAAARTASSPVVVSDDTGKPAQTRPGWPAFLPDGKSLVFHHQTTAGGDGNGADALYTRRGAKAHIAWTSITDATKVTPLNRLNGLDAAGASYLPKLATPYALACGADGQSVGGMDADHGDDANLNYEPTVAPIAVGGYVWVVFTSRRMYGNEASIPPYCSDPRGVDLVTNITTKKLWVAAIDLGAAPGTDASHPAFYLPAQELLAGNSRGFWVLDPCRPDGNSCSSGDQCCNGFCEPDASTGNLVCQNTPPDGHCSQLSEKCTTASDCCDASNVCVNGFCSIKGPQ
jgi:hypothetical protein